MSEKFSRILTSVIERGSVNKEDSSFDSILATEGEASDGHIIGIKGLRTKPKMPLLFGHASEALVPSLGSVVKPRKSEENGIGILRTTNKVNMNGDGLMSDIRRGMFQLIEDGDLNAMSIRWEGVKFTARTALPPDHKFFVDKSTVDFDDPRRWGMFFEKSNALEGSVVAIGADPKALIGRSQEAGTDGERVFFSYLARSAEESGGSADVVRAFSSLSAAMDGLRDVGVEPEEAASVLANGREAEELIPYHYGEDKVYHLPRDVWNSLMSESRELYRAAAGAVAPQSVPEPTEDGREAEQEEVSDTVVARAGTVAAMPVDQFQSAMRKAIAEANRKTLYKVFGKVD